MTLLSDAAMVLFYDIEGDTADHDDWHSHEHFHERLSVPGFLRATRWVSAAGNPRYMVIYEVSDVDVSTSPGYLDRLNNPSDWTREIMPRFRGMTRGFCHVSASHGFGQGNLASVIRFTPTADAEERLSDWISHRVLPDIASRRGITGAHLLVPASPPPMTKEQSLRGRDKSMPWLIVATGYDAEALNRAIETHFTPGHFFENGPCNEITTGHYTLHHTADAAEAHVTTRPPAIPPQKRKNSGPRY